MSLRKEEEKDNRFKMLSFSFFMALFVSSVENNA